MAQDTKPSARMALFAVIMILAVPACAATIIVELQSPLASEVTQ